MAIAEKDMFNQVAAEYDAVRPTYPDALFADLATVVGGAGQRVLEVGCGSGQATRGLLGRPRKVPTPARSAFLSLDQYTV